MSTLKKKDWFNFNLKKPIVIPQYAWSPSFTIIHQGKYQVLIESL